MAMNNQEMVAELIEDKVVVRFAPGAKSNFKLTLSQNLAWAIIKVGPFGNGMEPVSLMPIIAKAKQWQTRSAQKELPGLHGALHVLFDSLPVADVAA